jgi:hypothetical protein
MAGTSENVNQREIEFQKVEIEVNHINEPVVVDGVLPMVDEDVEL